MNTNTEKSIETPSTENRQNELSADFYVGNDSVVNPVASSNSIDSSFFGKGLLDIKSEMEKLSASVDGIYKKFPKESEAGSRIVSELKSQTDILGKKTLQNIEQNRKTLILISIVICVGLGLFSIASVFLVIELRKAGLLLETVALKSGETSKISSQMPQMFNEIAQLSESQQLIHLAIAQLEKNLEKNVQNSSSEKQLLALEKLLIAQSNRLALIEKGMQQARSSARKHEGTNLRNEIDLVLRNQRELSEAVAKQRMNQLPDAKPVDQRPQYPRQDNQNQGVISKP